MKKILFVVIFMITLGKVFAQEPADALRYSWLKSSGTARNNAVGGAGVSLGGEFSTLFLNPAGLAFYKNDEFVFTPLRFNFEGNKSNYFTTDSKSKSNNFNIGATGFIFSFPNHKTSKTKNFTLGLGLNTIADLSSDLYYKGVNNKSSYSEKFLEELIKNNVTDPNAAANNYPFGSSLALNTYLVDTIRAADGSVAGYKSLVPINTGIVQEQHVTSAGGITDFSLGGALNLNDKFFFGTTLSVPIVSYNKTSVITETDNTTNTTNNFKYFQYQQDLQTTGFGLGAKLGLIYKPIEYFRLGLAVQTPVIYTLTDKFNSSLTTDLEGYGGIGVKTQQSGDLTNNAQGESKYHFTTPWHITASASYVFREVSNVKMQRAFITADVEYVNYSAASFSNNGSRDSTGYFKQLNTVVGQQYNGAFDFRLGGELKFNKWMYRLGGAYYVNPYKSENADHYRVTGGIGYRDKGIFIDLTYVYAHTSDVNYPYRLEDKPNQFANVNTNAGSIVGTIGFKF